MRTFFCPLDVKMFQGSALQGTEGAKAMRIARILPARFLAGLMVNIGIPRPVEATIAEKVPIDGGNYSANDEGYLELDTHFTFLQGRCPAGLAARATAHGPTESVNSPPGPKKRPDLAASSPPITGDFGRFAASGGAFCRPLGRTAASPVTARISAPGKVYI